MYAVFWLLFLHVKVFFLVTFDSLVMFCLDYGHCSAYIYSNLQPEYQSYVELYQQEQTIFNNGYCLHSEHIYICSYI